MKKWLFVLLLIVPAFLFGSNRLSGHCFLPIKKSRLNYFGSLKKASDFDNKNLELFGEKFIPGPWLFSPQFVFKRNRWIAAFLAFPLPLGIMGAHRIFLGTKPVVPLVYVITLGGGVGIVPMIDFFVILFSKDISIYEENEKVLMWVK